MGVAVGEKQRRGHRTGEESLVVLVQRKLPITALAADSILPRSIDGVLLDVVEIGYPRAIASQLTSPRGKFEYLQGGISIGHYKITAGTLGAIVTDTTTGNHVILSNNHVLANSNDAKIGDSIYQPGAADGGSSRDEVARLLRWQPLVFEDDTVPPPTDNEQPGWAKFVRSFSNFLLTIGGVTDYRLDFVPETPPNGTGASYNKIDAAIALPVDDSKIIRENRYIGRISGTTRAYVGQPVRKAGRTTDYTEGVVKFLNATVDVAYGANQVARFEGQIIIQTEDESDFSMGGDSGSVIVERDSQFAVGLLFAGSSVATIANPINDVMEALGVNF